MSGDYHLEELARGIYGRVGTGPIQPNCAFIVHDNGVTLFDTSYSPAAGRAIAADVKRVTDKPIVTVVVSHHHWDHAWGSQVFGGATIIGHTNTRRALQDYATTSRDALRTRADVVGPWMCVTAEQFATEIDELEVTPPTLTYSDRLTLWLDEREVQLLHLGPAHTSGDTLLFVPAERILFAADVVCNRLIPVLGDGDPAHFAEVLVALQALEPRTVVPGHGAIGGPREIEQFAACLAALRAEVFSARERGAADAEAALKLVQLADYGDWAGQHFLPSSVRRVWDQLMDARPA